MIFLILSIIYAGNFIGDAEKLDTKNRELVFALDLMQKQSRLQEQRYILMLENEENARRMRHDERHHLATLKINLEEGNISMAQEYIDQLIGNTAAPKYVTFCKNPAANAIISFYAERAEKANISFKVNADIPVNTGNITESDLTVILGNLFENAIEACEDLLKNAPKKHLGPDECFIELHAEMHGKTLIFALDNSFSGVYKKSGEKFLSHKRNDFGIGLDSILSIAVKRGGYARFEPEGTTFRSSVYLSIG